MTSHSPLLCPSPASTRTPSACKGHLGRASPAAFITHPTRAFTHIKVVPAAASPRLLTMTNSAAANSAAARVACLARPKGFNSALSLKDTLGCKQRPVPHVTGLHQHACTTIALAFLHSPAQKHEQATLSYAGMRARHTLRCSPSLCCTPAAG